MFKKILIVILILLFIGVLSINITVNTDTSAIEEDIEENIDELEGFSFDDKLIIEEARSMSSVSREQRMKKIQEKIEADKKKQEKQRKAKLEKEEEKRKKREQEAERDSYRKNKIKRDVDAKNTSALIKSINNSEKETGKPVVISGGSFIKLQGKVQELQGDLYDLKNEVNTKNAALNARISNTVQKDQMEKKFNEYDKIHSQRIKNSEMKQENKVKSYIIGEKIDKLEKEKKQNAESEAESDGYKRYFGFF